VLSKNDGQYGPGTRRGNRNGDVPGQIRRGEKLRIFKNPPQGEKGLARVLQKDEPDKDSVTTTVGGDEGEMEW